MANFLTYNESNCLAIKSAKSSSVMLKILLASDSIIYKYGSSVY